MKKNQRTGPMKIKCKRNQHNWTKPVNGPKKTKPNWTKLENRKKNKLKQNQPIKRKWASNFMGQGKPKPT